MSLAKYIDIIKISALDGGPGFAQIAVTNDCNANCGFCNFAREKEFEKHYADFDRLIRTVDIMYDKGIRYLVYVGGEPLMYKRLDDVLRYTRDKGIEPIICTNAQLLSEKRLLRLKDAGLRNVLISIDAPDDLRHEENRGLPKLAAKIRKANEAMAREGMHATASVTVSKLLMPELEKLPGYLKEMGFRDVTFSYPLQELHSTYLSFSDSELVEFTNDELVEAFGRLKKLKDRFRILNPASGMDEMIRFVKGEPARFPCLAGYKYFFLDWKLDVYRCHYLSEPICSIEEFPDAEPIRDGCANCMIDCYRDPSVMQYCAVSLADSLKALRHGHPVKAFRHIFNRNNYLSVRSVMEEFSLVRRYREL